MKKKKIPDYVIPIVFFIIAIFGAFFRWLQSLNALDAETGLIERGAVISVILFVYLLLSTAVAAGLCFWYLKGRTFMSPVSVNIFNNDKAKRTIHIVFYASGAAILIIGIVKMFCASSTLYPTFSRLYGAGLIFLGGAYIGLFCMEDLSGAAAGVGTVASCLWLVYQYRVTAISPTVWVYAPTLIAIIFCILSFYELMAVAADKGNPRVALFCLLMYCIFMFVTFNDDNNWIIMVIHGVNALFAIVSAYVLTVHFKTDGEE